MIKIIHAADLHLDAPFSALAPEQAQRRREEQRELLERLADLAEQENAQLVLLPGDILDSDRAYLETTQALAKALGRMKARVFIAPGNHDFYADRSPWATVAWPENVHIFKTEQTEHVDLPGLNCTVHGAGFTSPTKEFPPLLSGGERLDGRVHIGCVHADVEGKGRYGNLPLKNIFSSGLDYLALGHIHACSGLQKTGGTWWAYPGCPEGRGFDELGEKGALSVSVDKGSVTANFVPLAGRKYEMLTVDVGGDDPAAALAAALPKGAQRDIYRLLLIGESGAEGLDLRALTELAAPHFYSVSLRDHTRMRRDLWSRAAEDTLTGLFLREMRARVEAAAGDDERDKLTRAVRFGLAALEDREDCCP